MEGNRFSTQNSFTDTHRVLFDVSQLLPGDCPDGSDDASEALFIRLLWPPKKSNNEVRWVMSIDFFAFPRLISNFIISFVGTIFLEVPTNEIIKFIKSFPPRRRDLGHAGTKHTPRTTSTVSEK
jgi:hypothetical protein